jgi:hypothetical protein
MSIRGAPALFAVCSLAALHGIATYGHPIGPMGTETLAWHTEQISRVVGSLPQRHVRTSVIQVQGRNCVSGGFLHFDVRDEFAFDIDETVELQIEFYTGTHAQHAILSYDRSDSAPEFNGFVDPDVIREFELPVSGPARWQTERLLLPRARFANLGFAGTDFTIRFDRTDEAHASDSGALVCGISLERTNTTPRPVAFGTIEINLLDEDRQPTAARMGVYAGNRRLPLPSQDALRVQTFNGSSRVVALRHQSGAWPISNQSVFYVSGTYHARLPVGDYQLVVSKGPEYRMARKTIRVAAGEQQPVDIRLERWTDMAGKGWYSGDGHVHYTRDSTHDDHDLLLLAEAEDLHVANALQMGNSGNVHFRQYTWQPVLGRDSSRVIAPGQEDPRTTLHGHALHLNLREPVRDPSRYLLYHEAFAKTRAQGAVTGYAHLGWQPIAGIAGAFNGRAGLALDVAFGLVDFVEVLQLGMINPDAWFDLLNLGYRLAPAAGTDWPYADVVGAVRTYVHVDGGFTPEKWFDGLRRGQTFITNGPMLEFTVNAQPVGTVLQAQRGDRLIIEAAATLNPDVDRLDRLDLIEQGEVIKTVHAGESGDELRLTHETRALRGTWFVLRAHGKRQKAKPFVGADTVAMSAPIYLTVGGEEFWKPAEVRQIVERLKADMYTMLDDPREMEAWETDAPNARYWAEQRPLLKQRIEQAAAIYDSLADRATRAQALRP